MEEYGLMIVISCSLNINCDKAKILLQNLLTFRTILHRYNRIIRIILKKKSKESTFSLLTDNTVVGSQNYFNGVIHY